MPQSRSLPGSAWPELPYSAWKDTYATLHLWTQIVGKVRLAQTPWLNHSWHVVLYLSDRGLTTSPIPYGDFVFEIHFDFIAHQLAIDRSDGVSRKIVLTPRTVTDAALVRPRFWKTRFFGLAHKSLREVTSAIVLSAPIAR